MDSESMRPRMLKRIGAGAAAAAAALALASCGVQMDFDFGADSYSGTVTFWDDTGFFIAEGTDEGCQGDFGGEASTDGAVITGTEVDGFPGCILTFTDQPYHDANAAEKLAWIENNEIHVDVSPLIGDQSGGESSIQVEVTLTFPGAVIEAAGGTVDGTTVSFASAGQYTGGEIVAEMGGGGLPVWVWIIIGVIVLALVAGVLLFFLVFNKKKGGQQQGQFGQPGQFGQQGQPGQFGQQGQFGQPQAAPFGPAGAAPQFGQPGQPAAEDLSRFAEPQAQPGQPDQFGQPQAQPGQFGQASAPQFGQPVDPSQSQFAQPAQPQPAQPGQFGQPQAQPGQFDQFGQPQAQPGQFGQASAPQFGQPVDPSQPQFGQPGQPQFGQPGQPQTAQPPQFSQPQQPPVAPAPADPVAAAPAPAAPVPAQQWGPPIGQNAAEPLLTPDEDTVGSGSEPDGPAVSELDEDLEMTRLRTSSSWPAAPPSGPAAPAGESTGEPATPPAAEGEEPKTS